MAHDGFRAADWVVFSLTLGLSLAIGVFYSVTGTRQRSPREYFLAGRSLGWLPVTVSITMSYISAVLVLGNTAEMYTAGVQYWLACIGSSLAFIVSAWIFVPFFYKLSLTSSFEYFEMRFQSKLVRLLASVLFLINSIVYLGLVMFSPATALEAATDIPVWASILATGAIATVYTTMGGMRAVVWTDFLQGIILLAGLITILTVGMLDVGGIVTVWDTSREGGRLEMWNFSFDPTVRLTFWSVIIGRFFISLLNMGVGQTTVQRYSSSHTLKDARLSAILNCPALIIIYTLTCLIGLTVYAYYEIKGCDPLANDEIRSSNQLLPYFIMEVVNYPGIPGIFLATLVSGALSTLSSTLNSMAACTWKDMLEVRFKTASEVAKSRILKLLVFVYGLLSVGMGFVAVFIGGHVLQATNSIMGGIGGPSLGMFLLGMFFPWANWQGTVIGCLIGFAMTSWVSFGAYLSKPALGQLPTSTDSCYPLGNFTTAVAMTTATAQPLPEDDIFPLYRLSYMYNSAFGCVITVITGIIFSFITGATDPSTVDRRLVVPLCDYVCCCLPARWRKTLWCGVEYDDEGGVGDEKVDGDRDDLDEDSSLMRSKNESYMSFASSPSTKSSTDPEMLHSALGGLDYTAV